MGASFRTKLRPDRPDTVDRFRSICRTTWIPPMTPSKLAMVKRIATDPYFPKGWGALLLELVTDYEKLTKYLEQTYKQGAEQFMG